MLACILSAARMHAPLPCPLVHPTARPAAATPPAAGSPWMLPWERRQLQGGALRWWEKMYWGVFVVGLSLILFNRIEWEKAPDPVGGRRVGARLWSARVLLGGGGGGWAGSVHAAGSTLQAALHVPQLAVGGTAGYGGAAPMGPVGPPWPTSACPLAPRRRRSRSGGCGARRSGPRPRAWC